MRDYLSEAGFCEPTERSKIAVFLAIERWKPGMSGSTSDWWVCLPKSLFLYWIDLRDIDREELRAILDKNKEQELENDLDDQLEVSSDSDSASVATTFYEAVLDEAREGRHSKSLRDAFDWLLQKRTPSITVGMVWYLFIGCHKQALLDALGVAGDAALNQTEWDLDALLGQGDSDP